MAAVSKRALRFRLAVAAGRARAKGRSREEARADLRTIDSDDFAERARNNPRYRAARKAFQGRRRRR